MEAAAIATPARLSPFEDATELLDHPHELRARADRDGFLFFHGLLDPEPVLELRGALLGVLARHGLLAEGTDSGLLDLDRLARLPADDMREDIGVTQQIYFELQRVPALHRLPHHPSLLRLYRTLFGAEIFVHPRHILRAMTPHPAMFPTPPHQDFPLVQGSADTWTCWAPIGCCSIEKGPLAVLRGSHSNGYLPVSQERGAGGIAAQLCDREDDWVGGSFGVGDVLTFSALTVHRSLRPTVRDEVRLSMDVRYQRASDEIDERSLGNHAHHPWAEIYEDWSEQDRHLMYYWDRDELTFRPRDDSLMQPGARRIC